MGELNIETKAAETILQKEIVINVGDRVFKAAPPSVATLILVSEAVSRLPDIQTDREQFLNECLAKGKECEPLGEIAAILLLGARNITKAKKEAQSARKRRFWGLFGAPKEHNTADQKESLAQELLETLTPSELSTLISSLLNNMQIADFFVLTTFLKEANVLKQTKVEN